MLLPPQAPDSPASTEAPVVHGMTISTRTSGSEWGTPDFEAELDRLVELGVNWVAIHPYAGVRDDGSVRWREWEGAAGPDYLTKSIEAAHARGLQVLIKPHLAYWGSGFGWRGEIGFEDPVRYAVFWSGFRRWTVALAEAARAADGFSVGCELKLMEADAARWRALIRDVRAVTSAQLTYAANWDTYAAVPFWDALDAIGVQAYFPLAVGPADSDAGGLPTEAALRAAWAPHVAGLREVSERTGKPVVFLELGYDRNPEMHVRPWESGRERPTEATTELQRRCLAAALAVMEREQAWLRGGFLWKWFVHPAGREDFSLDHPVARDALRAAWGRVAATAE